MSSPASASDVPPRGKKQVMLAVYSGLLILAAAAALFIILPGNPIIILEPAVIILVCFVITTNIIQYAMTDEFSFSLAIIPELAGLYLYGPGTGFFLILITIITNIVYRYLIRENGITTSIYKFFLNLAVLSLALCAAFKGAQLLQLSITNELDTWKFFILVILFGLVNNFLLVVLIRIITEKWIFPLLSLRKIGLYICFSIIMTPLVVFAYQDRGVIGMLLLLILILPFQIISQNSHKLQTQQNALIRDALTGCYNYHYLKTQLTGMIRNNQPFAFALADLDYFKEINDTYGHVCGNEVLMRIARDFRHAAKGKGSLFRYGGDEFCFLTDSRESLEEVLAHWSSLSTVYEWEKRILTVGYSIGTLIYDGNKNESFESIISKADQEMYRSKIARKQGRN